MSDDLFHLEKFSMEQPKPSFKVELDDIALSAGFHESIVLDIEFADAFTDESAAIFVAIDKIFHDYLLILGRRKRQHMNKCSIPCKYYYRTSVSKCQ